MNVPAPRMPAHDAPNRQEIATDLAKSPVFLPIELGRSWDPAPGTLSAPQSELRRNLETSLFLRPIAEIDAEYRDETWDFAGSGRPYSHFVDSEVGCLGPYLRVLAVLKALFRDVENSSRQPQKPITFIAFSRLLSIKFPSLDVKDINPLLRPYIAERDRPKLTDFDASSPWFATLIKELNEFRKRHYGAPPLTALELLKTKICHPGENISQQVIDRFTVWAMSGALFARDDSSQLLPEHYIVCDEKIIPGRLEHLKKVLCALVECSSRYSWVDHATDSGIDENPDFSNCVVNIWSPQNWVGLRAFATKIIIELRKARYGFATDERLADVAVAQPIARCAHRYFGVVYLPLSRILENTGNISRASVLRFIATAFGYDALPIAKSAQASDAASPDLLSFVRTNLTKSKTVIIFDAVDIAGEPFGPITEVLKDADWSSLIREISQPRLSDVLQNGGGFDTRILVLSGREISSLKPWRHPASSELPPLTSREAAMSLISSEQLPGTDIQKLVRDDRQSYLEQMRRLWMATDCKAPALLNHEGTISTLFETNEETLNYLADSQHVAINDITLALASCARTRQVSLKEFLPKPGDAVCQVRAMRKYLFSTGLDSFDAIVLLALSLTADGLRLDTILRVSQALAEMDSGRAFNSSERPTPVTWASVEKWSQEFSLRHKSLVILGEYESESSGREIQRAFELAAERDEPFPRSGASSSPSCSILDIRFHDIRELIIAAYLYEDARDLEDGTLANQRVRSFRDVCFVLSEESLLQATQILREKSTSSSDILSYRLLIQTAFLGLLSIDFGPRYKIDGAIPTIARKPRLRAALPEDPYKRHAYLYEFIYRRCIENAPYWNLSRGFGRDDLRSALLATFVNPGWARRVWSVLYTTPVECRKIESFAAFDAQGLIGFGNAFDLSAPHLRGMIGVDAFKAVLQVAARTGRLGYAGRADAIAEALCYRRLTPVGALRMRRVDGHTVRERRLPGGDVVPSTKPVVAVSSMRAEQSHGVPERPSWLHSFDKISLDALQMQVSPDAEEICIDRLHDLGINAGELVEFDGRVFLECEAPCCKLSFETNYLSVFVMAIVAEGRSQKHLQQISDIFFRLGELEASQTDFLQEGSSRQTVLSQFAKSYAYFWVADRVRSAAATCDSDEVEWPLISARSTRYYVRVCLKMAKIIASFARNEEDGVRRKTIDMALAGRAHDFYVHARERINVYTRHLFRIPAERVSMLLLMASAARVRGEICETVDSETGGRRTQYYELSLSYIKDAKSLLMEIGYHQSLAKRLLLERYKTVAKLLRLRHNDSYVAVLRADLNVLLRLSQGNAFWSELIGRLKRNMLDAAKQ